MRKLYDFVDMNMSPKTEERMIAYMEDEKNKVYTKHVYKEGVHLPKELLEKEFKYYIDEMSKRFKKELIL